MHAVLQMSARKSLMRIAAIAVAVGTWTTSAEADPVGRFRTDMDDLTSMQREHPGAAEKFAQAEAQLAAENYANAADLLKQVLDEAPQSALAARRRCQAFTALDRHDEAVENCRRAVGSQGSALDFRAAVGAFMSGEKPPTPEEAATALMFARRAQSLMPDEPWGQAAWCDVAARLGDTKMFNQCLEELVRTSPGRYETIRAHSMAARFRPRWWVGVAWVMLGALGVATLVRALRRARTGVRRDIAAGATALLMVGAVTIFPRPSLAQEPERAAKAGSLSKWKINDNDPASSIPSPDDRDSDPLEFGYLLMDLGDKATAATEHGDHAAAAKYYAALAKAVPDRAISFSRMCDSYEKVGDWEKATISCATALTREGVTFADYTHYGRLMLSKKAPLEPQEIDDVDAVITRLKTFDGGPFQAAQIQCGLGARLWDKKRLEECTTVLNAGAPDDPGTLFFQWALAMVNHDFSGATKLLEKANTIAMDPERLQRMRDAILDAQPIWRRGFRDWRVNASLAILVGGGLAMFLATRKSVLRYVQRLLLQFKTGDTEL
jgi:tetratricopeptide (TPR) repeat protein